MYRIRFLLPLLPLLLAACATRHAAPSLATAPIPALSYAAVLDGGTVTPIESPIIVKYAPYPTASFERLMRVTGTRPGETVTFSGRMTGTTSAVSSGDFVEMTFAVEDVTSSPNARSLEPEFTLPKGTKITLLIEPFGPTKNVSVSLPPANGSQARAETVKQELQREFAGTLPERGLHQGDTMLIDTSLPGTSHGTDATLKGKAIVNGQGTYRGRPVIVCEVTGIAGLDGQSLGMHSFKFLDIATGLWSHTETVIEGPFSADGKAGQLRAHFIDDVRF
jgi:hypothetical protein